MFDPMERLRAANPEPDCPPPSIDDVWRRINANAGREPHSRRGLSARRSTITRIPSVGSVIATISTITAMAIAVLAVVLLDHKGPSPATRPSAPAGASTAASAQPLAQILGVLRRPQTKADRDLGSELTSALHSTLLVRGGSPVTSLVRLAAVTPWGGDLFLVPIAPPTRQSMARLPASLRASASRALANARQGLTLAVVGERAGGFGGCCETADQIKDGDGWILGGHGEFVYLLLVVPDGVARVTVLRPRTPNDEHPLPLVATVHDNLAAFWLQRPLKTPGEITWFGPSGNAIKRIAAAGASTSSSYGPPLPVSEIQAISPDLAAAFAVFRRPASASDRLPAAIAARLSRATELAGLNLRLARRVGGTQNPAYLVPGNGGVALVYGGGFTFVGDHRAIHGELLAEGFRPGYPEVIGLAPDGVSRVTFKLVGGGSQSVNVHDNVYQAQLARRATTISFTGPSGPVSATL
ncbi:MAG: hypothetical protein ACLP8S_29085 [Solirubrobacteraceae bacterium]